MQGWNAKGREGSSPVAVSQAQCYAMIPSLALYVIDKAIQLWAAVRTFQCAAMRPTVFGGCALG